VLQYGLLTAATGYMSLMKGRAFMQIHIPHTSKDQSGIFGDPVLLYAGKLEGHELSHPRSAHAHPDIVEFVYILKGKGEYEISNKRYPVTQEDLIVYNQNVVHYEFSNAQKIPILFCAATGIQRPGLAPNCIFNDHINPVFHVGEEQRLIRDIMQRLFNTALLDPPRSSAICQSLFLSLLHLVIELVDNNGSEQGEEKETPSRLGQMIRSYVDAQPVNRISIPQVAEKLGISESYMARTFKKSFGYTLIEYLMKRRIGEAQTLLLTTHLTIMEIAECVGYQNQSYFSKIFAEYVGLSPLRYRKMYQGRKIQKSVGNGS